MAILPLLEQLHMQVLMLSFFFEPPRGCFELWSTVCYLIYIEYLTYFWDDSQHFLAMVTTVYGGYLELITPIYLRCCTFSYHLLSSDLAVTPAW